jgi:hypothetical protein
MVLSLKQNTFILMSYYRNGTLQNRVCKEEFLGIFRHDNIMEANLIAAVRMIVDWFVATRNVEKG